MKIKFTFPLALAAIIATVLLENCSKDKTDPTPLTIVSASTDSGVALTGGTQAVDVPLNASLIIVFDRAVDTTKKSVLNQYGG